MSESARWQPEGLGASIFNDRYTRFEGETWEQACQRVASHVAQAEENGKIKKYDERFYEELVSNRFMPGGRTWYGAGRPKAQLINCFVIPTSDSREGWGKTVYDTIVVTGTGGGIGINCSPARGRGFEIKGTGGISTGAVSLMQMINGVGNILVAGGGRRTALMLALDITHPDIEEFLDAKLELHELNNANISVILDDMSAEEFQRLVQEDGDIHLKFAGRETGKTVKAKKLWNKMVYNAWKSGEPGILNINLANRSRSITGRLVCSNPCFTGETQVWTLFGPKRFDELVGTSIPVLTEKLDKTLVYRMMKNIRKTGTKEVYKVTLRTRAGMRKARGTIGSFTATADHIIFMRDGTQTTVSALMPGDRVASVYRTKAKISAANSKYRNHEVVSVEYVGVEDVYDGEVEETHRFFVITEDNGGVLVHNCGEIVMGPYSCCVLGSLVGPRFVNDGIMNWDQLDASVRMGVRFLDNVITVNEYPLAEIKNTSESERRIGLGLMGLHSMLLELGLQYSSAEGLAFIDQLFSFIKNTAYDASINLAIEKGAFPEYDAEVFLNGGFSKTLKRGIRNKIKEHGIRNCAVLTMPPTGTTAMVAGVSSGIEPLFAPVYLRHYWKMNYKGERYNVEELVITPEFEKFGEMAEGAYDLTPRQHFEVQKIVQSHIDNAVTKTINLPKEYPVEELGDLWLEYLPFLKGTTFYREGSRENEPLQHIPTSEARAYIEANSTAVVKEFNAEDQSAMDCIDGVCELPVATMKYRGEMEVGSEIAQDMMIQWNALQEDAKELMPV